MRTYKYDPETKEYLFSEEAFLDPMETEQKGKEIYLIPADSTFTAPLDYKEGYAVCWNGTSWEYIEDHRQKRDVGGVPIEGTGTAYWLPEDTWRSPSRYMKELGPLPEGALLERPEKPFSQLKIEKLNEINATYQQAIATLTPTYPDDERLTFDKQEQEARSWIADNDAETPFVDALAAGRQMEKAELVSRIIAKADAFALASGSLTGQRQRYEDMLDVAETAEAVAAIVPQYSLPGMEAQA